MKKQLIGMGVALALLCGGGTAQAALMTDAGGGFEWTADSATSLDWLDLSHTLNRSYNDVSSKLGSGAEFDGWRYATVSEVQVFLEHATNGTYSGDGDKSDYEGWTADVAQWVDYTYGNEQVRAITSDFYSGYSYMRTPLLSIAGSYGDSVHLYYYGVSVSAPYAYIGSWLVRDTPATGGPDPVPEPATALLFGSGLAGLAAARRRKNIKNITNRRMGQ